MHRARVYIILQSRFARCRTHYAQIGGTAENRRSLLSDEGLQLFRGRVHVLAGLHAVHPEQRSVREEHIRVPRFVRGRTEALLRAGCMGDAKARFIKPNTDMSAAVRNETLLSLRSRLSHFEINRAPFRSHDTTAIVSSFFNV